MAETRSSLIRAIGQGPDRDEWREFITIYQPLIARTARQHGVSGTDIDDIVQDVMLKLVRFIDLYNPSRGSFRSWLRRVTINRICDQSRRKSHAMHLLSSPAEIPDQVEFEEQWNREFRSRLLQCAIAHVQRRTLPKTWFCFLEHALHQRPAAEVARELALSENAVYVNCSRIMARVRSFCTKYGEEPGDGPCPMFD